MNYDKLLDDLYNIFLLGKNDASIGDLREYLIKIGWNKEFVEEKLK